MQPDEYPRFNMPYELGLDIGAAEYGNAKLKTKRILILEKEKFHYQRVLSDISGQDIENHDNDPITLIKKVRNWISVNSPGLIPGKTEIWAQFNTFAKELNVNLSGSYTQQDIDEMTIGDYIKFVTDYVKLKSAST